MSRRRFCLGLGVALLAVLALAGYRVQTLLDEQRLAFDWQHAQLSWRGLQLHDVRLRQGEALFLQASLVQLNWRAREAPDYRLHLDDVQLDWQAVPASESADTGPAESLRTLAAALPWLPQQIAVNRIEARLPCRAGRCTVQGALNLQRQEDALQVNLRLLREAHTAELQARLHGLGQRLDSPRQLDLSLHLDAQQQLTLHSQLEPQADTLLWRVNLSLPALQKSAGLGEWLGEWLPFDATAMPATLHLQGVAALDIRQSAPWALQLRQLQLDAHSPRLALAASRLDELHLSLALSGTATAQQLHLRLADTSHLSIRRLRGAGLELQHLQAALAGLQLQGTPQSPALSGPLDLRVQRLVQAQLQAQGWQWQGQVEADRTRQHLAGTLQADAGLSLALRLNREAGLTRLDASLDELFLRAGNPLAQTLADWPPLLTLDSGRLLGNASLQLPDGKPLLLKAGLTGRELAGIYDRSTLSGLDSELQLQLNGDRLRLDLTQFSVRQINPGIALGPLHLQASYQAGLQQPLAGSLNHQRAELGVLGGSLSLAPATWDLREPSQLLPLRLSGLNLQQLFRAYPAEGLDGSGLLDGNLPLRLGRTLSIEQGRLEARAPGGRLRFDSPRIRAMGQANSGMQLVTRALEDFHYDRLSSSLDFAPSGTLRLGMRLHGQNPAIEQGRPIHFNITLEEDIPALLASLQLSSRVSDTIRQRIQQRMRQRVPNESKE